MISLDPIIWLSILLIFMMWSIVWKENIAYRTGEYIIIGFSGAAVLQGALMTLWNSVGQASGSVIIAVDLLFAGTVLFQMYRKTAWIARFATAWLVGAYSGLTLRASLSTDLVGPLQVLGQSLLNSTKDISYLVFFVAGITTLIYFLMTKRIATQKPLPYVATVGRIFLFVYCGIMFAQKLIAPTQTTANLLVDYVLRRWLGFFGG